MRNTLAIARKELGTYVSAPMAYVVAAVFLALTGFIFVDSIGGTLPEASIKGYLVPASLLFFLLLASVLTMRLLAEEQKLGTLELLLTSPVQDHEVVLGKFLASFVILVGTLALTLYYPLLLFFYSNPDPGPILTGYLGLVLLGSTGLAVGLLASSMTSNQIVAVVVAFGTLLLLFFIDAAGVRVVGITGEILTQLSLRAHLDDFRRGVIDLHSLFFYVLTTALFLFLTVRVLEARRWH